VYGIDKIPQRWCDRLFEKDFIIALANGLHITLNKGKNQT